VIQVAAGSTSTILPTGDALLPSLANQPSWLWPTIQLGFILGPVLWVIAFVALATTLKGGWRGTLASLAVTTVSVGAAVHIVSRPSTVLRYLLWLQLGRVQHQQNEVR
jgi:hypothetical protein